jgi:pimeloyl-ACP methyl ester carboxylesterase
VLLRRVLAFLGGALLLASCSLVGADTPDPVALPSPSSAPPHMALAPFYEQQVDWQPCRETYECASVRVPLDYTRPDGRTIALGLLKVPATAPDRRIGSLLVNPGGPGASAQDYAAAAEAAFGPRVREAFDVVGMDPRGVGESTPVDCVSDPALDAWFAGDPTPDTDRERRAGAAATRALGRGCLRRSGDLAWHVSTVEVARDLDVVRQLLGDDSLAYFGASYGTFIGATYADLFPQRVGRMVLDGAIDPTLSNRQVALDQAAGVQTAFVAYVDRCLDEGDCFLGDTREAALQRVSDLLARLDREPLGTDGERVLTEGLATYGLVFPLYAESWWKYLDVALRDALDGDGTTLLALADAYANRGPDGFLDNQHEVFLPVGCLDRPGGLRWDQVEDADAEFLEASPTFGRFFSFGMTSCEVWPVQSGNGPGPLEAAGAAPILVVGTSRDPATPMRWAEGLADQLDSGVLVRRDGDGHGGYRAGNDCVDEAVEDYLVAGEVPEGTTDC